MIILSLGSNLSSNLNHSRFENINNALSSLYENGFKKVRKSNFYETPSYPDKTKPKFINIIISLEYNGKKKNINVLDHLIFLIFDIENKAGRIRTKKNDPRVIDIDIIDYNNQVIDYKKEDLPEIKIPHEKASTRNFVLFPLKEICPNWKHPQTDEDIDKLIDKLSESDKKSILMVEYN